MDKHRDVGKGPWRAGKPPSVGWWPASFSRNTYTLRWWDGEEWSTQCGPGDSADDVEYWAAQKLGPEFNLDMQWRDRADWWPERSRT